MSEDSIDEREIKKWAAHLARDLNEKEKYVLSKIDGLYNVLVAVSTFIVGLLISQHNFFMSTSNGGLLFLLSAIVVSLLVSYGLGFHGMIKSRVYEALRYRILSWSVLLTSLTYFTLIAVGNAQLNGLIVTYAIMALFSGEALLCGFLVNVVEWRLLKTLDFDYRVILNPGREGFIAAGIAFLILILTCFIWIVMFMLGLRV